jgi:hypothetical protein
MKEFGYVATVLLVTLSITGFVGYRIGQDTALEDSIDAQTESYSQGLADGAMLVFDEIKPELHDKACSQAALSKAKQCKSSPRPMKGV